MRFALISGADEEGPAIVAHGVVAALPIGLAVLMKPRVVNAVVCAGSVVSNVCVRDVTVDAVLHRREAQLAARRRRDEPGRHLEE